MLCSKEFWNFEQTFWILKIIQRITEFLMQWQDVEFETNP